MVMRSTSSNSVPLWKRNILKQHRPMDRRRRRPVSLLLQVLLLTNPLHTNGSYLCNFLDDTWQSLEELLKKSSDGGFVMLCPFSIKGEGCPADDVGYVVRSAVYIMCEPYYSAPPLQLYGRAELSSGCKIDCPGTHFVVEENGSLTLDSITLKGSKSSAIKVQSNASLTVFNSHFEQNNNDNSNGGGISAVEFSDVYLSQTSFLHNSAPNGGALFILGSHLQVHNSQFVGNVATSREVDMGGGAIYMGLSSSTAYLTNSKFYSNTALVFGPAILDMTHGGDYIAQSNTGCHNVAQSFGGEMACNGALQVAEGVDVCFPFENSCEVANTAMAASPQLLPSGVPSVQRTTEVNSSAPAIITYLPSEEPTIVASTSKITFSPTGSGVFSDAHTEPIQTTGVPAAAPSPGRPFQGTHSNEPTPSITSTSSEADSGKFLWSYELTSATTAQPSTVQTIQTGIPSLQDGTADSFSPLTTESRPIPEPSNSEAVIDQLNEVPAPGSSCVRLDEINMLSSQDSYMQGTLDNAPFDMTGLSRCGASISAGTKGRLHRLIGSGAVMTAHTCSFFFEGFSLDTQLSIYTSDIDSNIICNQDLTCVGTNNDNFCGQHSLVNWLAEEGELYFIYVQGKSLDFAATVQQHFSLTLAPAPGGSCEAAILIKPNQLTGELELPVVEDPSGMDQKDVFGFVWFTVAYSDFSWLIASACREDGTYPSHMRVFQGSCEAGALQPVETIETTCLFGQILTWLSEPEERYYIKAYNL